MYRFNGEKHIIVGHDEFRVLLLLLLFKGYTSLSVRMTGKKKVLYFLNRLQTAGKKTDDRKLTAMLFIISENFMGTLCKCHFY